MARILVTRSDSHPVDVEAFRGHLPTHDIATLEVPYRGLDSDARIELIEALEDREILFLRPGKLTAAVFEGAPSLRMVAIHGSGYDRVDLEAATAHDVVVTHNPDAVWPGVLEHTFGLIFSLMRSLPTVFERTNAGEWNAVRDHPRELSTATLGVVGLGRIGFQVARVAAEGFGADVLGYDPYVDGSAQSPIYPRYGREAVEALGVDLVSLETLLERAGVVTVHVPKTDETVGLLGADELDRMAGSYLINTARGGIVDEEALLEAIEADRLAGVALDVLEQEPPSADDSLLRSPSVLTTPHIAGISDGYLERAAAQAAEKIDRYLGGERPPNVLNPKVFDADTDRSPS